MPFPFIQVLITLKKFGSEVVAILLASMVMWVRLELVMDLICFALALQFSGCSIYEERCRCPNTKLPKSSIKVSLSPSQCYPTCMYFQTSLALMQTCFFFWSLCCSTIIKCIFLSLGWSGNRWSLCTNDTAASSFSMSLPCCVYI